MRYFLAALALILTTAGPAAAETAKTLHGIAMHGAPKYPAGFKHFDYVNPDAPKGGTVRQASIGSFDSLNPFIVKGESAAGIGAIYDSLTKASADEPFTRYGLLAESMEMPEDRSWIVFNLRKEARWHDGKPVTADDVVFTFNIVREKGAPQFKFYYSDIDKVEKLGDYKVKFSFKGGENREMPLIVGEQAILPKHYWEGRAFDETSLEPPLGSGAYKVADLEPGRHITYTRVADYWGKDLPVNVGFDNFDTIRYDYYRDTSVVIEAFKAGEFDFRSENSSKDWATAYNVDEIKTGEMIKDEIKHNRSVSMQGFVYNTRRPLFQDPKVREALAYAFDFERSNKTLFYGQYVRTRSYFDNSELAATGLPSKDELALLEPLRDQLPPRSSPRNTLRPPPTARGGSVATCAKRSSCSKKPVGRSRTASWSMGKGSRSSSRCCWSARCSNGLPCRSAKTSSAWALT